MSTFKDEPSGLSATALELLDQGLRQIWHEMQLAADAKSKAGLQPTPADTPSAAGTRVREQPAGAPIKRGAVKISK